MADNKPPVHSKPNFNRNSIPDDLHKMRAVLGDLLDEIGKEKNYFVKSEILNSLNNINAFNFTEQIPFLINQIKGIL